MKVINLFAGPGSGKSTTAYGIAHLMKSAGINCELVTEHAKDLTWEQNHYALKDQISIFAEQNRRLERLRGKVDYAIVDSPLLQSIVYIDPAYYRSLRSLVTEVFHSYDNINFFIDRVKPFNPAGRNQDEAGAREIDSKIIDLLNSRLIWVTGVKGDEFAAKNIMNIIEMEKDQ